MAQKPPAVQQGFDMDLFMRACGWEHWKYGDDKASEGTILWSDNECVKFGRVGDQFFYDDVDDWECMDAFFEKYPEAKITQVWHHPRPNLDHLITAGKVVNPGPRKGSISVIVRVTAPWPTSFDEALDLLTRWNIGGDEEDRAQTRRDYENVLNSPPMRAKLGIKP